MGNNSKLDFETKCVHSGISEYEFGSVVPPIYQTSTFKFSSVEQGASLFAGKEKGYIYTRLSNPTVEAMEEAIADLENGYKALGCSSGMAAIHTVFGSLLKSGDHVVCSSAVYGPSTTLLKDIMKNYGIKSSFIDTKNVDNIKNAILPNTKIIYVETPANPTLDLCDLSAVAEIANKNNIILVVDNTFMSPALQTPIDFGADIVIHSLTKFLNGHADVIGGVIIAKNEELHSILKKSLVQFGGVIDPFNAFLVHRGLKTLSLRMKKHCENAQIIAEYLEDHPLIQSVKFPGLKSYPQYQLGQKQHKGPGGMISFELKGGFEAGKVMMNSVRLCALCVSLGGVESLIQHPASMTHFSMGKEARLAAGITDELVRLSVGIENVNDLIDDLKQSLEKVNSSKTVFA